MSTVTRLRTAFTGPHGPVLVAGVAVALSLPALSLGLQGDDHIWAWQVAHGQKPWELFRFSAELADDWRQHGGFSWWTSPRYAMAFMRPLSSLTHFVDFTLWPHAAWLMALLNVLLYGACTLLAAVLYRRLAPSPAAALLASLLFAIDDGHAPSVGWISGRNTLLALFFSLLALLLHMRACEQSRAALRGASAVSVALALLSGEAGTAAVGLLAAHAITLQNGSVARRFWSIAPQLAVSVLWAGAYVWLGCGVRGSAFYRDLSSPASALGQGLLDLPLHFTSLLGPSIVTYLMSLPLNTARLVALPVALLCVWLLWPRRGPASASLFTPAAKFFVLSSALCLVPAFLCPVQDRLLMASSFGAFGWIGAVIACAAEQVSRGARLRRRALLAVHGVLALLLFPLNLRMFGVFEPSSRALADTAAQGGESVLLNSPLEMLSMFAYAIVTRDPQPAGTQPSVYQLYVGGDELWLERPDAHTLDVTATAGWAHLPAERVFTNLADIPRAGSEVHLRGFTAQILRSTADGRPERVRFVFPSALESSDRRWLIWRHGRPERFTLPSVGTKQRVAALSPLGEVF